MPLTIFRDVRKTSFGDDARRFAGQVVSVDGDFSAGGGAQAGERFGKFGLSVALHASDAKHFAAADCEGYVVDCFEVALVADCEPFHLEDIAAGFMIFLVYGEDDLTPNHHVG